MNAITSSRERMLSNIREALKDVTSDEAPGDVAVARKYRTTSDASCEEMLDRFIDRLIDYKARVRRVTRAALTRTITEACQERGVSRLVVPSDLPEDWVPQGLTALKDPGLSIDDLESSDGVLTGCAVGIAETGTIVLDSGPRQGRRILTLLPDYYLCVVFAEQVVGLVPEAIARMAAAGQHPGHPLTMISGPSATSDIELNRVEGVHGPRTLEVIVVEPNED